MFGCSLPSIGQYMEKTKLQFLFLEAVNLDSWPTTAESSPDQDQWRSSTAKTAKIGAGTSAISKGLKIEFQFSCT